MPILDSTPFTVPEDQSRADGFIKEANIKFDALREDIYDSVRRFWFAGLDENDPPRDENDPKGGIRALQAMGNNAKPFMEVAYARVEMLVSVSTALGKPGEVDMSKVLPPYTLTYDDNGALESWTLN